MKFAVPIARVVMALPLIVFGLNGLFHFMEQPQPPPEAGVFLGALVDSGYVFPVISVVKVVCGICFLTGRFVPLALLLFAPILVNIVCFHVFLDPAFDKSLPGYVLLVGELFLAWVYWGSFSGVLAPKGKSRLDGT